MVAKQTTLHTQQERKKSTQNKAPQSLFEKLLQVDVSKHTYDKPANRARTIWLTYLQWGWGWRYLMYIDPKAKLHFKEFPEYDFQAHKMTGRKVDYMNTANGAYVTAILTIRGVTHAQSLPVMDSKNNTYMNPPITAINKSKQRAFIKCLALFGLGLSLFIDKSHHKKSGSARNASGQSTRGGSSADGATAKQQKTIKWLVPKVGAHLTDGDATKFTTLKHNCASFNGASKFLDFLFDKKKALGI